MEHSRIRRAGVEDLPRLAEIYNYYVEHTATTFDVEPVDVENRRRWWEGYGGGRRQLLVLEVEEVCVGYACSSALKPRAAYDTSVEVSVYLDHEQRGLGYGRRLYEALFAALEGEDLHRAYGCIALPNEASIALHRSFGFRSVGVFREVGRKFDRYWDVEWMEKQL